MPRRTPLRWGDSHHPALSETAGKYDGRWLYINDRAHGRIGMVDLSRLPRQADPPGAQPADVARRHLRDARHAVRPHLVEGPGAEGVEREPGAERHARRSPEPVRGHLPRLLDVRQGRPEDRPDDPEGQLPDRAAALHPGPRRRRQGRRATATRSSTPTTSRWRPAASAQGKPPIEVGASQLDFDYLHIINWKKAEQVVAAGKFTELNGIRVITLETAIAEGLLLPRARAPQPARRGHRAEG